VLDDLTKLIDELVTIHKNFRNIVDLEINLNSPDQMAELFYNVLDLEKVKVTKTGKASTDDDTIEKLAEKHEFPNLVKRFRNIMHDKSNYIDAIKNAISDMDGRIHPHYSQTRSVTGRLSCSNPALHNIKRKFMIRNMVVPEEGNIFVEADLSQAEVRMLAALSKDQNLIDAFKAGGDIHMQTACRIFGLDIKDVTKEIRARTKGVVFSIIYGSTTQSVADSLNAEIDEVEEWFNGFYRAFPQTKEWMDQTKEQLIHFKYVTDYYGRRRRIYTIDSEFKGVKNEALRQCVNARIQSSATADYSGLIHIKLQYLSLG